MVGRWIARMLHQEPQALPPTTHATGLIEKDCSRHTRSNNSVHEQGARGREAATELSTIAIDIWNILPKGIIPFGDDCSLRLRDCVKLLFHTRNYLPICKLILNPTKSSSPSERNLLHTKLPHLVNRYIGISFFHSLWFGRKVSNLLHYFCSRLITISLFVGPPTILPFQCIWVGRISQLDAVISQLVGSECIRKVSNPVTVFGD